MTSKKIKILAPREKKIFFLHSGEYCSIVLMSTLSACVFLGGYNITEILPSYSLNDWGLGSIVLILKTLIFCFLFVWIRSTLPRVRFDQIIKFAWTGLLPLAVGCLILVPSLLWLFDFIPSTYCF